jgi:hypothetical protein
LLSASSAENEHGQGVARLVRRNPPVGSRRPVSPAEGVGRQGHPAESRVGRQALEETAPRARPDAPKVHADKHRARRVAGIDATGCRLDSQSVVRGLGHRLSGRDGHRVVLERYGVAAFWIPPSDRVPLSEPLALSYVTDDTLHLGPVMLPACCAMG